MNWGELFNRFKFNHNQPFHKHIDSSGTDINPFVFHTHSHLTLER